MSQEDRGFELYLHGIRLFLSGDYDGSGRVFRNSLELVKTNSEKGLVLSALGQAYFQKSGAQNYVTGVSERGASSNEGEHGSLDLECLAKSMDYLSQAADFLSGNDLAKAKYEIALALKVKIAYLSERGSSAETEVLLLQALEHLKSGLTVLGKYDKLYYCFFMHQLATTAGQLYGLTKDQHYYNSAKEYCAAAVRGVTENHFEGGMQFIVDYCLSF